MPLNRLSRERLSLTRLSEEETSVDQLENNLRAEKKVLSALLGATGRVSVVR